MFYLGGPTLKGLGTEVFGGVMGEASWGLHPVPVKKSADIHNSRGQGWGPDLLAPGCTSALYPPPLNDERMNMLIIHS